MSDPEVSTSAETQNPAPETQTPEVVAPEVEATQEASPEVEPEPTPEPDTAERTLQKLQRRIDKLTAKFYRTDAENQQLRRALEQRQEAQEIPLPKEEDLRTLAKQTLKIERFAQTAKSIVDTGSKQYPDYMPALKELVREVGDFVRPNGEPSPFMEVVMEVVDKPADQATLLYYLGKNPDIAEDLADLSPIKLATKLDSIRRGLADKTRPKPSLAPKPIEPVASTARSEKRPDEMTMREFTAWRLENGASRR